MFTDRVEFYDVSKQAWSGAPSLNKARINHSSCVIGDMIYTFYGNSDPSNMDRPETSIERLNTKTLNRWETIMEETQLSERIRPLLAPFSNSEIYLLGGKSTFM